MLLISVQFVSYTVLPCSVVFNQMLTCSKTAHTHKSLGMRLMVASFKSGVESFALLKLESYSRLIDMNKTREVYNLLVNYKRA